MDDKEGVLSKFIIDNLSSYFAPKKSVSVLDWAAKNIYLPSDTAEPGKYNAERAPYQKEILERFSPDDPTREIFLLFGSQTGKTTIVQLAMLYYMKEIPSPQAFAFPNEGELKAFVKMKFNPILGANPQVRATLGRGLNNTGDTLTEKQYAGGFLRFVTTNVASNLRGYSVRVMICDEADAYPVNVEGEGDPLDQLKKRQNTFEYSKKYAVTSTPVNHHSHIIDLIENSSYRKYFVPCPHCKELLTLEFEDFHYTTNDEGTFIKEAYFECPHCKGHIYENDKPWFMKTENGAKWIPTNPLAPPNREGYFLPSFYVPLGWLSWKSIAQEYLDAVNEKDDIKKEAKLTAFYNTVLGRQYKSMLVAPEWRVLYEKALRSDYGAGGKIPQWVSVITTGTDVQKYRIETTVIGWGKRGRNLTIEHHIFGCSAGEDTSDPQCSAWKMWEAFILNGEWEREDGFILHSTGNGVDRSYNADTINILYRQLNNPLFIPIRGNNKHDVESCIPTRKETKMKREIVKGKGQIESVAVFYDTPVDKIKSIVYQDLSKEDDEEESRSYIAFFPNNLTEEFYQQLTSEEYVYDSRKKTLQWVKIRERNETLDCRVYNYAIYFLNRFNELLDQDWSAIEEKRRIGMQSVKKTKKKLYGTVSKGIKL